MAKQSSVPDDILKKFNKPQFKINEPVYFTWLGMKKYGYVTEIKTKNWGIQYTVAEQAPDRIMRYPCGISVKGQKTSYNTGCIFIEETRSIGAETIVKRIQTGDNRTSTEVFRDTRRPISQSGVNNNDGGIISGKTSSGNKSTGTRSTTKDAVKPSAKGVRGNIAKERGNSELDSAIEKQRNFLNGFVKKD